MRERGRNAPMESGRMIPSVADLGACRACSHVCVAGQTAMNARRSAQRIARPIRKPSNTAGAPFGRNPKGRGALGAFRCCRPLAVDGHCGAKVRADGSVRFRLWAPAASRVDLVLERVERGTSERLPMKRIEGGFLEL